MRPGAWSRTGSSLPDPLRFFATAPRGVAFLLADELRALGANDVRERSAGVDFTGDLMLGYRACLWSRLASRVLLQLADYEADDADSLYAGAAALDWDAIHAPGSSIAVEVNGTTPALNNTHFSALKVKDAIVDRLRDKRGERPSVDPADPDLGIHVLMRKGRALLSFDLASRPLHRRGYRRKAGSAPLRENLAAAILIRAGWSSVAEQRGALLDPMCGSGTLPIEAALIAGDVAPGLLWGTAGPRGWRAHDRRAWHGLLVEAADRQEAGAEGMPPIVGCDADAGVLETARANAAAATVAECIRFETGRAETVSPPAESGLVIVNPPYGERLEHDRSLVPLYTAFGERLRSRFGGWQAAILTPTPELGFHLGLRSHRQGTFFNGPIECRLLEFEIGSPPEAPAKAGAKGGAPDFENRLRKNLRQLRRWVDRDGIECYRVYDQDLPEYALAIDVYGRFVHVQEYAPPKSVDPVKARKRLDAALAVIPGVLRVAPGDLYLKQRKKGKGGARYGKLGASGEYHEVREGQARFLVNFTDHVDTGLFLDHRPVRALIGEEAAGKRFLNLFCYTATATVHAALGGASSSVSVDMSNTYLEWARRNFALNGVDGKRHTLVHADCTKWLAGDGERFDLVFLDPPTFSSSKKMEGVLDVQRDHVELIEAAMRRVAPGGSLLFSTNNRKFKLDEAALAAYSIEDLSRQLLPEDFKRRPNIHRVWRIRLP